MMTCSEYVMATSMSLEINVISHPAAAIMHSNTAQQVAIINN